MRHDDAAGDLHRPVGRSGGPLPSTSIVEIGCGTGSSTVGLCRRRRHRPRLRHLAVVDRRRQGAPRGARPGGPCRGTRQVSSRSAAEDGRGAHAADPVDTSCSTPCSSTRRSTSASRPCGSRSASSNRVAPIVVTETPNRLTYFDRHTSQLPFFHCCPSICSCSTPIGRPGRPSPTTSPHIEPASPATRHWAS